MLKEIETYLEEGYAITLCLDDEPKERPFDETHTFLMTKELIKECFSTARFYRYVILTKGDHSILFEPDAVESYLLEAEDLSLALSAMAKESDENQEKMFEQLQSFLRGEINDEPIILVPEVDENIYIDDPYFDDPNHLCVIEYYTTINLQIDRYFAEDFAALKFGYPELISKRGLPLSERHYSDHALIIFLLALDNEFTGKEMPNEAKAFFMEHLLAMVDRGDYDALNCLGYQYYEGTHGFPQDYKESERLLSKAYSLREDPSIANTLGYIYYYGRANGGVPEKEKAFQYFAIAHFAGGYFEATYKLSDCYLKGYGTPVSEKAAFRLVDSIFEENYRLYLDGHDAKYADICLRLGNFYSRGIAVEKNVQFAYVMYHFACSAIKNRLQNPIEYPGDRSVAIDIFKAIKKIEKENGYNALERKIDMGGYVVYDKVCAFKLVDYDISFTRSIFDDAYQLEATPKTGALCQDIAIGTIRFNERVKTAIFLIKFEKDPHIDSTDGWKEIILDETQLAIEYDDDDQTIERLDIKTDGLIYVPSTMEYLDKRYKVLGVKFNPQDKRTYYYLLQGGGEVAVDDTVTVDSNGKEVEVIVSEIYDLYEDELPLPVNKMGIARMHHFA